MNSSLLNFSGQRSVALHFYNYYGFYTGSFHPREMQVSGLVIVKQSEHYLNKNKRLTLAIHFVESAVFHMLRTVRKRGLGEENEFHEVIKLAASLQNVKTVSEVMGIEGMIRQNYYKLLNKMIPLDFNFEGRTKRPPRDPFNALISFGNSMMYTAILSEVYKTQLNPTVSYLHEPSQKRYSLCLDLAEIFKPLLIDPLIVSLVNTKKIQSKHFDDNDGIVYLNDEGRKLVIAAFDEALQRSVMHRKLKRKVSYRHLIRLECYKIIKHVIGDTPYQPLRAWW